jgi:hypothetical protein
MKAFLKMLAVGAIFGLAATVSAQANGDGLTTGSVKQVSYKQDCYNEIECRCERIKPLTMKPDEWQFFYENCVYKASGGGGTSFDKPDDPKKCGYGKDWKKKHHKKGYDKHKRGKKHYGKYKRGDKKHYGKHKWGGKKHYGKHKRGDKKHYGKHKRGDKKHYGKHKRGDKKHYGKHKRGDKKHYGKHKWGGKKHFGKHKWGGKKHGYNKKRRYGPPNNFPT